MSPVGVVPRKLINNSKKSNLLKKKKHSKKKACINSSKMDDNSPSNRDDFESDSPAIPTPGSPTPKINSARSYLIKVMGSKS